MKYNRILTSIVFTLLFILSSFQDARATVLGPGDLLFTGYLANASTVDSFSFVLMVPISGTTTVNFTDNGWLSTNVFRAGEQTITWTYTGTLPAGTEIVISGPSAGAGTATTIIGGVPTTVGSCSGSVPSLATSGDQVVAYSGTVGAPTLISVIHMNVYSIDLGQCGNTTAAALDPTCIADNANFSVMPLGLGPNVSSIWIGTEGVSASEQDNAKFVCGGSLATAAEVRAAVTNQFKWVKNSIAPPSFTLPSGCGFFGLPATSAGVSVSGRVIADGRGVGRVAVSLTNSNGVSRTVRTSPLGYFRFEDVAAGESYVLSASSKTYTFVPRALIVADEIADLELIAEP